MKLTLAWFLFYGRKLGMTRQEILSCPVGEMKDMIACQQIADGAAPVEYASIDDLEEVR